jgi:hypothetical protein
MMAGFPNVPALPGVPSLPRAPGASSFVGLVLLTVDAVASLFGVGVTRWGIYLDGVPVFLGESTVSFEYKQDWSISDYPVEQGGFQSYDKVQLPFDVRVKIAAGGSAANRQELLNTLEAASNTLDLYDVYTPEKIYRSCNITHVDYRRTASNGVGLIIADVWLTEIRETAATTIANPQQPNLNDPVGAGNVQPVALTPQQVAAVNAGEVP